MSELPEPIDPKLYDLIIIFKQISSKDNNSIIIKE